MQREPAQCASRESSPDPGHQPTGGVEGGTREFDCGSVLGPAGLKKQIVGDYLIKIAGAGARGGAGGRLAVHDIQLRFGYRLAGTDD